MILTFGPGKPWGPYKCGTNHRVSASVNLFIQLSYVYVIIFRKVVHCKEWYGNQASADVYKYLQYSRKLQSFVKKNNFFKLNTGAPFSFFF